jgi:hypothetical protein
MRIEHEILMSEDLILITSVDDEFPDYSISLSEFWDWVVKEGLNLWHNDYFDYSKPDGHGEESGKFTKTEYLALHHKVIEKDILSYISK